MLFEYRISPLSKRSEDLDLGVLEGKLFSIEHKRPKFHISFLFWLVRGLWREYGPRAVEEDISCELLVPFKLRDTCSMDAYDVTDPLRNRQVVKLVSKQDQSAIFNCPIFPLIYVATLVRNL